MKRLISIPAILLSVVAFGQGHLWTLTECIDYALEHNIGVKQQDLQVRQQEIELNTARNSRLPGVSASASENFSFGRGLTADNTYSNTNTTSTGLNLGASVPVFQGLRISNTIKQNELNLKAVTAELEKTKDDVSVAVAQAYFQILYNMEILEVAMNQVKIDSLQVERLSQMALNGKASASQVASQKAAMGASRLSATQAKNNLDLSVLDLTQLLELPQYEGFSIARPEADVEGLYLPEASDIFSDALQNKPAVKAEEFRLDATRFSIKNAKSAFLPTISASGGIGTNYYTMSSAASANFAEQMKNNFSQFLGLSISVPIFNGFQTRNQVRSAELSRTYQHLQLESTKKALYKEIQQACASAIAAREKYNSGVSALESAEEAFALTQAKYENGKATITEFNESRDYFLKAQSDLLQAKYEYIFDARLLDFYRGKRIDR